MAQTGFGTVTMDLGRALLDLGVDVRFMSQNEMGKLPPEWAARTMDVATFATVFSPTGLASVGDLSEVVPGILQGDSYATLADGTPYGRWKPDAALVIADFWGARYVIGGYVEAFTSLPTYHYCPVEGVDLPRSWAAMWSAVQPIAMSRFGQVEMAKVTGTLPPLLYHGVDTDTFYPVSTSRPVRVDWVNEDGTEGGASLASKEACKVAWQRKLGIPPDPRRVMALRTDRHVPRKGYNAMLRALVPVLERRPELDVVLHCRAIDEGGSLADTISKMPQGVQAQVHLTGITGLSRPMLVSLYNAADLYLSSGAEGFGLTIAEAIACGVPAIGLDYSAVPEVIGPAGQLVPVGALMDNPYDHFWALPEPLAYGRAVDYLVSHPSRRREMGAAGPGHVAKHFQWADAARRFVDVVDGTASLGRDSNPRPPTPALRPHAGALSTELPRNAATARVPAGVAA